MTIARKRNGHGADHESKVQARINSLRSDVGALQDDMRGLVGDVGDAATDQVHEAVNDTMQSVHDAKDRIEVWGDRNLKSFRKSVRNQPLKSCMLAVGAGAILGAFLLRR